MKHKRIVCAACRCQGIVILGPRHWDAAMHRTATQIFFSEGYSKLEWEEGFVDQHNVFFTREEAWMMAEASGQIIYRCGGDTRSGGTLYSENLY